jgi:hypothetical protein
VDGHDAHAVRALLDDGRFGGTTASRFVLHAHDE